MAKGYTSPGISYTESSVDSITNSINTTSVGIIGFAIKGGFEPTEVKTVQELHKIFGTSYVGEIGGKKIYSKAIIAAERILKNTNSVVFCRLPLDETQKQAFTVTEDEVEFTVSTYDASISKIRLTQTLDDGEIDYKYTISEIHNDGTERVIVKDVYEEDLEGFVEEEGTLVDFKVVDLPIAPPAPITTQTITAEYGEAVVTDTTPIYFDSYRVSERMSEEKNFVWDATEGAFIANTETVTYKSPIADVDERTYEFEIENGEYIAHCDGYDIKCATGDGHEGPVTYDGSYGFQFEKCFIYADVSEPIVNNEPIPSVDDQNSWGYNINYLSPSTSRHPIDFRCFSARLLVEVTAEKVATPPAPYNEGKFHIDFSKFSSTYALPIHIGFRKISTSEHYKCICLYGAVGGSSDRSELFFGGSVGGDLKTITEVLAWCDTTFGAGFITLADPSVTTELASSDPLFNIIRLRHNYVEEVAPGMMRTTSTYTTCVIEAVRVEGGVETIIDSDSEVYSGTSSAIRNWLRSRWWCMRSSIAFNMSHSNLIYNPNYPPVEHLPTSAEIFQGTTPDTYGLKVVVEGTTYTTPCYTRLECSDDLSIGGQDKFSYILIMDKNIFLRLDRDGNHLEYTPVAPLVPPYQSFTVSRTGTNLFRLYTTYNCDGELIEDEDTTESDMSKEDYYSEVTDAFDDYYDGLSLVNTTQPGYNYDKDFPLAREGEEHSKIKIVKRDNGNYNVILDGDTIVENATTSNYLALVNNTQHVIATRVAQTDDRDFPIEQPREVNVSSITITSAGTDTYNVTIHVNGEDKPLVSGATSATIISALAAAQITLPHTGTITPLVDVRQLITGRNFPIFQGEIKSHVDYTIGADALYNITNIPESKIQKVFNFFKSTDDTDISLFIAPYGDVIEEKINASSESATTKKRKIKETYSDINDKLIDVVETRNDCMSALDYPMSFSYADALAFLKSEDYDCANACTCYPNVTYYDKYEEASVELPASAIITDKLVYVDSVDACWYAPAGLNNNRGVITDGVVTESITSDQKDELYNNRINPIRDITGTGAVIWGNKTLKKSSVANPSVYSNIGVRRLANYIKKVVTAKSLEILFAPNDSTSWDAWKNAIRPVLREIQNNRGIDDFKVVMDRTTISDEDLAAGRAPGVIYVKPTKAIEYIPISFVMTRNKITFDGTEN